MTTTVSTSAKYTLGEATRQRRIRVFWHVVGRIVLHIALILLSLMALVPVLWMISSSLKASTEVFTTHIRWDTRKNLAGRTTPTPLRWLRSGLNMLNTMICLGGCCARHGSLLCTGGLQFRPYALAGQEFLLSLLMATMMLPGIVMLVPRYVMFAKFFPLITGFRWVNTFLPLIVPSLVCYPGLLRVPLTPVLLEHTRRTGRCSPHRRCVFVPRSCGRLSCLCPNRLIVSVTIFSFLYHYSDFLEPLIYLSSVKTWTLAVAIRAFNDQFYATSWELVFASGTFALIPMVIIFFIAQRYFVQGIHLTGFGGR